MKDGYYLSVYIHADPLSNITKICSRHDQNISLWKKTGIHVELLHYWELERISGIKKQETSLLDTNRAIELINTLLSSYKLSIDDMVEVWGTPGLDTVDDYHSIDEYPQIAYHSIAHLFSGILFDTDIFNNGSIIGLAVDGGPDYVVERQEKKYWYAGCVVQRGEIHIFPIDSPGPLWSQAKHKFDLEEGSLMALASASVSAVDRDFGEVSCVNIDSLEAAYRFVNNVIDQVKGLSQIDSDHTCNGFDSRFTYDENIISMAMKEIQAASSRMIKRAIHSIIEEFNIDPRETHLSLSGGFALNCPTNSAMLAEFGFKDLLSPPCVNDGGQSLGIALYAFYKKMPGHMLHFKFATPYYGDSDESLDEVLEDTTYAPFVESVSAFDAKQAIADLKQAPIVWFNGRTEVGPRALGNRSILADPRQEATKELLNRIKQRQWWRPVAPVVLEEYLLEWFEDPRPSPFMLQTFRIKPDKLASIPAISHLDESARVQSVNAAQNYDLYQLISAFHEDSGVPMLCNTSLNDKGEPMINTIAEAFNFCLRKAIKVGYFNGRRVQFKHFEQYPSDRPLERKSFFFEVCSGPRAESMMRELNPYDLGVGYLRLYLQRPDLQRYDLKNEKDAKIVAKLCKIHFLKWGSLRDSDQDFLL